MLRGTITISINPVWEPVSLRAPNGIEPPMTLELNHSRRSVCWNPRCPQQKAAFSGGLLELVFIEVELGQIDFENGFNGSPPGNIFEVAHDV